MRRQAFIARQFKLRYYSPQREILSTMTVAGSAQTMAALTLSASPSTTNGDGRRTRQAVPERPRQRTGGPRAAICLATGGWLRAARWSVFPAGWCLSLPTPNASLLLPYGSGGEADDEETLILSDDLGALATGGCYAADVGIGVAPRLQPHVHRQTRSRRRDPAAS